MQEIDPVEIADTVLDAGEVVITRGEDVVGTTIAMRVGDGQTPGGALVSDPFSFKTPYMRLLSRRDYTIVPHGNATFSSNIWDLITPRDGGVWDPANTGGLYISSAYPIAMIAGVKFGVGARTVPYVRINDIVYSWRSNLTINASELESLPIVPQRSRYAISNLQVYAWHGSHLLNTTNDAQGSVFLVRDPSEPQSAIPLAWWQDTMAGRYAADWSHYPATSSVDVAWQDIRFNPFLSVSSSDSAGSISLLHTSQSGAIRDVVSVVVTSSVFKIVGIEIGETNVTIAIDAAIPFGSAPVIQATTNLPSGLWTNLSTTSTWPEHEWVLRSDGSRAWKGFVLTAAKPAGSLACFRVSGASTNVPLEAIKMHLPVNILPSTPTNAPSSGVVLYVDGGKLWAVTAATNRVCLTP